MGSSVVYVDDTFELPARTRAVLESVDLELLHVRDAKSALRRVREARPALLFVEVLLAAGDGFDLIERLGSTAGGQGIPIVIVTRGERSPELYGRALECGVRDFLCKPVVEAQLLEAALAYGEDEAPAAAGHASAVREGEASSGDLVLEPLPAVLARLHRTGASGALTLVRESEKRGVQLRNGSPVAVSGVGRGQNFEDYLLSAGWIKSEQHEAAIDQVLMGNGDARAALVGMGALTAAQLEQAEAEQAHEGLMELFAWPAVEYEFVAGARLPEAGARSVTCDPVSMLFEGVLERLPETVIRREFATRGHSYPRASTRFDEWVARLDLVPDACGALASLSGDRSLAVAASASDLDERLLYAFVVLGAVRLEQEPELQLVELAEPESDAARAARKTLTAEAWLRELADRVSEQDDFALFDVDSNASDAEVQAAYRALLGAFPNTPPEFDDLASRVRARIDQAYGRIKNEDTRAAFAALRAARRDPSAPEAGQGAKRAVDAEEHFRRGCARLEANDPVGAVEALGMAMHLDPNQGDYPAHLGYALYLSDPDSEVIRREALEHIANGVKLAPDRATPLLFLGRVFRRSGDPAMAEKMLRRALAIAPDHPAVLQEMCLVEVEEPRANKGGWLERFGLGGAPKAGRRRKGPGRSSG